MSAAADGGARGERGTKREKEGEGVPEDGVLTLSVQGRSEKHGEDGSGLIDGEAGGRRRKGTA